MLDIVQRLLPPAVYPHPIRTEWKQFAMLRRDNPNTPLVDIAKQLGFTYATLRHWVKNPLYQAYESWLLNETYDTMSLPAKISRADMKDQLDEFAVEMLDRLRDIVETSNDEKLIAQIGFDALDRAGYEAPRKEAARPINLILTPEVIRALQQRSYEVFSSQEVIVGENT